MSFSSLHDYLLSEEILAKAALHIGVKDIILTEVSMKICNSIINLL